LEQENQFFAEDFMRLPLTDSAAFSPSDAEKGSISLSSG
jgi:hypothetical protein